MCDIPSLEIHCARELEFPELREYEFSLERKGSAWVLEVYRGPEGCLCRDGGIAAAFRRVLERLAGELIYYYPNDYRDSAIREVTCSPIEALERFPITLETQPVRVKLTSV